MNIKMLLKKGFILALISNFFVWQLALATPEGGQVVAGSATVTQTSNQTTVNQASQNTVINWHGFDTASNEAVKFTQPNASSIALNRINSGQPTNFQGSLSANGQVWILNPAGVLFTSTSHVDVAGLLVTTHNITDSNFMAGNYQFTFDSNNINSKIINNGLITVQDSGIVALVGPGVENNGTIIANLGKVYLSSGDAFVLDMYGDNLINFGSSPAIQKGYVSNSGLIKASGGKVHMTANAAAGVLDNVISMSGVIEATTASTGTHGEIILNGGHAGTTKVTGTLNASDGGKIETSGAVVDINSATINAGVGGSWTLDPWNITIVAGTGCTNITCVGVVGAPTGTSFIGVDAIAQILSNGTSVTLNTGNPGPGADVGDINFNATRTIAMSLVYAPLTLNAFRDININSTLAFNNTRFFLNAGRNINVNASIYSAQGAFLTPALVTVGGKVFVTGDQRISANQSGSTVVINSAVEGTTIHGDSLTIVSVVPPTYGTIGATTPLKSLTLKYPSLTVNATLASFVNDQLNIKQTDVTLGTGTFEYPVNINPGILTVSSPITETTGTASLTLEAGWYLVGNNTININAAITLSGGAFTATMIYAVSPLQVINLGADISAFGGETYNGAVVLTGTRSLTSFGGDITFNNTVDALTSGVQGLTTLAQTTIFNGIVGASPLNALTVQGTANIYTTAVTTLNDQIYSTSVVLGSDSTLTSTAGGINFFNGTINSDALITPRALTLNAPSGLGGTVTFNGTVGNSKPLSLLNVTTRSGIFINTSSIATMGAQNYLGIGGVYLEAPVLISFTGSDIFFNSGVTNLGSLATGVSIGGNLVLGPNANLSNLVGGSPGFINTLTVSGSTTINNTGFLAISTQQNQTYTQLVTLNGLGFVGFASTGGSITFGSTVNGASTFLVVLVNPGTSVNFNGIVGGSNPLSSLKVIGSPSATVNINTLGINTTGLQSYSPKVVLGVNSILTAGAGVTFNNTVDGPGGLIVNGNLLALGDMGFGTALDHLTVNGIATGINIISNFDINLGPFNVVTNDLVQSNGGSVSFLGGPVTLFADLTVSAANKILFGFGANGVTGPFSLTAMSFNPVNAATGAGISGSVNVAQFSMGGLGGGNISPVSQDSFVTGQGLAQAFLNTVILPGASGFYCVNGFCTLGGVGPTNNIPPAQIFALPVGPNCGVAGCDNSQIILFDSLNGLGMREDIVVYPIGISPELMYSPNGSNIQGIVIDSVGAPSQAINSKGIMRELKIGSAIYKSDQLIGGGNSCVCVKTASGEKKCKQHDEWSNTCNVGEIIKR